MCWGERRSSSAVVRDSFVYGMLFPEFHFSIWHLGFWECDSAFALTVASEPNSCKTSATKFMYYPESSMIETVSEMDKVEAAWSIALNVLDSV
jgi:hypothetical protein